LHVFPSYKTRGFQNVIDQKFKMVGKFIGWLHKFENSCLWKDWL